MTEAKWPYARVAAHRGCGTMAPENTLEGFRTGLYMGYRAMETDAMLAKDGVLVLMHDEKFGRTVRGEGRVPEYTAQEIRCMDAGSYYAPQFAGVPPAGFEQAVRWCRANGVWLNIEIKPAAGAEYETGLAVGRLTNELYADVVVEGGSEQRNASAKAPLFSSFKREALRGALETAPDIPRGFLVDDVPEDVFEVLRDMKCVSLHVNYRKLTPEFAAKVKKAGYWLFCYTPNDPNVIRELFSWGVDGVCTDRLDIVSPAM